MLQFLTSVGIFRAYRAVVVNVCADGRIGGIVVKRDIEDEIGCRLVAVAVFVAQGLADGTCIAILVSAVMSFDTQTTSFVFVFTT